MWIAAVALAATAAHTKAMTLTSQLRASVLVLMVAALMAATLVGQLVTSFVVKALGDSKSVRVMPATTCKISSDGAHFTGCSSIL